MHKNSRKVSCFLKNTGIFRGAIFHAFLKMKAQDIFFCLYRRKLLCREYKSSYITDCRWYYPMWPMNDIFSTGISISGSPAFFLYRLILG